MNLDGFFHSDRELLLNLIHDVWLVNRKLDAIARGQNLIFNLELENMATLEQLTATAEATETTIDSAIVVINGIADRVAAAGTDPVKLQAVVDGLKGRADALAFAIAADASGTAPVVPPSTPN